MRVLKQIGQTLSTSQSYEDPQLQTKELDTKGRVIKIFTELGIMGESGCKDLVNIIEMIINEREGTGRAFHKI